MVRSIQLDPIQGMEVEGWPFSSAIQVSVQVCPLVTGIRTRGLTLYRLHRLESLGCLQSTQFTRWRTFCFSSKSATISKRLPFASLAGESNVFSIVTLTLIACHSRRHEEEMMEMSRICPRFGHMSTAHRTVRTWRGNPRIFQILHHH
jgi:hypothetical protein